MPDEPADEGPAKRSRLKNIFNTILVVSGALLIGQTLHIVFVEGVVGLFEFRVWIQLLFGIALVAIGHRIRPATPPLLDSDSDTGQTVSTGSIDESEFNPELSPLGGPETETKPSDLPDEDS